MHHLQRTGGLSALINAAAYLAGLVIVFTVLAPVLDAEPMEYLSQIEENKTLLIIWHVIIYLVAGVFMVPLILALHDRFKEGMPALSQIATAIGVVWVATIISSGMVIIHNLDDIVGIYNKNPEQAETVWLAMSSVGEGLGGAIELPGGLWMALVSLAALRLRKLPVALGYLGIVVGGSGVLTTIPGLYSLGYVFGLGAILWFVWTGFVLLRK
ncbi:MAG: DUF4386 family protein [Candidatus Cohnella colombiensis]|uniref:DUF4386 family protein n=1 Tax=Candidatus Cohnella colombiensis TaxID=3121368 RepID=A0AA95JGP2_9BACL|nr:MAG: DUF4386 family protein [Cohnella sp.]